MKRSDYISWDEYFMGIAMLAARRSKDPNTQVGACIVSMVLETRNQEHVDQIKAAMASKGYSLLEK